MVDVSVGLCVGITAVLKIFFYGCPPVSDMRSPSGHTGFSVLVYGGIALVTAVQTRGFCRILAVAIGSALILTIAVSRLVLEIHTLPEVSLGFIIGMLSLTPIWADIPPVRTSTSMAADRHYRNPTNHSADRHYRNPTNHSPRSRTQS